MDLGSGWSALLGALIGGGASYTGNWLSLRYAERNARDSRKNDLSDRRFAIHQNMVAAAFGFSHTADIYMMLILAIHPSSSVSDDLEPHDLVMHNEEDVVRDFFAAARQFNERLALALIAGPSPLTSQLRTLSSVTELYRIGLLAWMANGERPMQFYATRREFLGEYSRYVDLAQEHLELAR